MSKNRRLKKGDLAEEIVVEAAKALIKEDNRITGFHHSQKSRELDSIGIDLLIFFKNGLSLPLQIKSSQTGLEKHIHKHPLIKNVLVVRDMDKLLILSKNSGKYRNMYINLVEMAKQDIIKIIDEVFKIIKNSP